MSLFRRENVNAPNVIWYEGWTDPSMDPDGHTEPLTLHHTDPNVALSMFRREAITCFRIYRVAVHDEYASSVPVYGMRPTPDPEDDEYGWLDYRDKPDPAEWVTYIHLSHELAPETPTKNPAVFSPRLHLPDVDVLRFPRRRRRDPEHVRFWTNTKTCPAGGHTATSEDKVRWAATIVDYDAVPTEQSYPMFQHDVTVMPDGTVTNVKHALAWGPTVRDGRDMWGWLDQRDVTNDPRRVELLRLREKYEGVK
ncbi:hypothetical protein [Aeromicrobium sp. 179-A 4D2 NHS]|uniref:hypothetical protein n=1 Tax=Aeromicrobium sp. 179-A 4D2 NHS TaxID=3142375 RepID=UPI0039A0BD90